MVECPICQHQLEADFGMISCPSCQNILIVDIDGSVRVDGAPEELEESVAVESEVDSSEAEGYAPEDSGVEPLEPVVEEQAMELPPQQDIQDSFAQALINESVSQLNQEILGDEHAVPAPEGYRESSEGVPMEEAWSQDSAPEGLEPIDSEPSEEEEVIEEESESSLSSSELMEDEQSWLQEQEGASEESSASSADLSEIADYGNSEISLGKDGLYFYDVRISGIDTSEDRQAVVDVLQDRRFSWESQKLVSSVKNGVLVIEKLSAVKASVLVNRIKGLTVKVQWKQNVITQMDLD